MTKASTPPVRGVIVYVLNQRGQILFMLRNGGRFEGSWWPVAGTPKDGESDIATALRELEEETRIRATNLYRLGLPIDHMDGRSILSGFVTYVSDSTEIQLNHEHVDWQWRSPSTALTSVPAASRCYIQHLIDNFITQAAPETLFIEDIHETGSD